MERRAFLIGTLASLVVAPRALAQTRRPGWSPTGPLDGREPVDANALTAEEQRHAPLLVLPAHARAGRAFDVVVQVGVDPHVMTDAHRVEWIELAVDEARAFVSDLGPNVAYPIVRFSLALPASATLTARAYCNQHGVWRTRRAIEVR
jgi:superoxide reductase